MVNQRNIINRISDKTGLKKQDIKEMLLAFKQVIYDVIKEGDDLFLKEVFTIKTVDVKGRNRYIAPYEEIVYQEEHKSVKIIPSRNLINVVKKDKE